MKLLPFVSLINQVVSKNPAAALLAKGLFSSLEEPWRRDTNKPARRVQCLQPEQVSVSNTWPVSTATQHCRAREHGHNLSIIIPQDVQFIRSCLASQTFLFYCHIPFRNKKRLASGNTGTNGPELIVWTFCAPSLDSGEIWALFNSTFKSISPDWRSAGDSCDHRDILVTSVVLDSRLLQVLQLLSWAQSRLKSPSYALWLFKWLASKRIHIFTHIQQLFTFNVTSSVTVSTE